MLFFDYDLPEHLIAQQPATKRDEARLLVVHRSTGTLDHRTVRDLPELLAPGDLLVFNNTRVIPARLLGRRTRTQGKWEGLFLTALPTGQWELLCQTRGYAQPGEVFETDTGLTLVLDMRTDDRHWMMTPQVSGDATELLARHGHIPLPPYIRHGIAEGSDQDRYQTVYATRDGSVAAPTAGLHFTPELIDTLTAKGIANTKVTLHVGLGTFAPIREANPLTHAIHQEWCEVGEAAVNAIETAARNGKLAPFRGPSNLAIYPPYDFRVVNGLMTNFHLPKTTLLLLVQSLCDSELLQHAYAEAIRLEYRFYSYGDAMLIV